MSRLEIGAPSLASITTKTGGIHDKSKGYDIGLHNLTESFRCASLCIDPLRDKRFLRCLGLNHLADLPVKSRDDGRWCLSGGEHGEPKGGFEICNASFRYRWDVRHQTDPVRACHRKHLHLPSLVQRDRGRYRGE